MRKLSGEEKRNLKHFVRVIVPRFHQYGYNMPFINFVFNDEDLKKIKDLLLEDEYSLSEGYITLKNNLDNYQNGGSDSIYIVIPDYVEFANFLYEVDQFYLDNARRMKLCEDDFWMTIWVRMGVEDITNVSSFLRKQLAFLKDEYFLENKYLKDFDNYTLGYNVESNGTALETNRKIIFSIKDKETNEKYQLPAIHYSILEDDGVKKCYIYAIQSIKETSIELKYLLKKEFRKLKNRSMIPTFILSLKYFVDLLKENDIYDIEVPLLQVFNYDYHLELDKTITEALSDYTEEQISKLLKLDDYSKEKNDYNALLQKYNMFHDKADSISKRKTEMLLDTFIIMQEKYNNIEILNEPFIQGDSLIVKINKEKVLTK